MQSSWFGARCSDFLRGQGFVRRSVNETVVMQECTFKILYLDRYGSGLSKGWRIAVDVQEPSLSFVDDDAEFIVWGEQMGSMNPYYFPPL